MPDYRPQPRSGRNVLLHRQPARPSFGSVGEADRYIARRSSPGAHSGTPPHRPWVVLPDHMPRSHALSVDLAPGRRQFPRAVARYQNRHCEIFACRRVTITRDDQSRGTRDLAAPVLGAHDTRRWRLCNSHGLYAFHPVKHGLVAHPADWPFSSFRRCVDAGLCPQGWTGGSDEPQETGERV
jgi:hypothetical protein